mmetsp:Transcript_53446/g.79426  ORF Transcript_53446/g.79426 Transcript_53446/m.79426 type:complete len:268 (-) Transcript_53446:8-811(-)|eukprot:CAMPEP_0195514010 /NCGR_PEP_ID=MMETSP0794_2-20130614/5533_1 /TAXON_ID=515487 /ORGANISM="Stephanopyxis turris, Strain CCMP 815" /LENGTH=267 /DNA_ID=CAMNT_0040642165 /DNA_START=52 /DNA_END=855 /DNA_ORIENTATION=-
MSQQKEANMQSIYAHHVFCGRGEESNKIVGNTHCAIPKDTESKNAASTSEPISKNSQKNSSNSTCSENEKPISFIEEQNRIESPVKWRKTNDCSKFPDKPGEQRTRVKELVMSTNDNTADKPSEPWKELEIAEINRDLNSLPITLPNEKARQYTEETSYQHHSPRLQKQDDFKVDSLLHKLPLANEVEEMLMDVNQKSLSAGPTQLELEDNHRFDNEDNNVVSVANEAISSSSIGSSPSHTNLKNNEMMECDTRESEDFSSLRLFLP